MSSIVTALKLILNIVSAIPTILKFIREVQREIELLKKEREEKKRQEEMRKVGEILKDAQAAENEGKQREALSRIIDDYNK